MTAWLTALTEAWEELSRTSPVALQFRSRLISADAPLDVLAAMRATDDAPCLMLQTTPAPDSLFELGGMRLSLVPDRSGTFLVLSLEDRTRRDLFATICADVISAASQGDRAEALTRFLARLDAWRQFLRDRRDGLSRAETIGLIGELLVLEQLGGAEPPPLQTWEAPSDGLHDFVSQGHALEVKTSLGPASTVTISALDQLDASGLRRLDLLHVRLIELPDGRSLGEIIASVEEALPTDSATRLLENALLRRGLMPDDDTARTKPRIRLRSIDAYAVSDDFPRLVRSALPLAISDATYKLDIRALAEFTADTARVLDTFLRGEQV